MKSAERHSREIMKNYLSVYSAATYEKVIERSRFIANCAHVQDEEEAKAFVAKIRAEHSLATHNCYAFVADKTGNLMRFSDDGEPQGTAGMPILDVLKNKKLFETAVVVTRYFGGVKLGAGGLVRAYTAIARDGDVIDLTLYKRPEGEVVKGEPVFKPETARSIRAMMMNTVRRGGTASIVKVAGYTVAGKTGTANKVKNGRYVDDTVASFVGIIPATRPRFVIAVMIDEPKRGMHYGGKAAGPVFNEVAAGALRTMMVSPDFDVAAQEALKEQKRGARS